MGSEPANRSWEVAVDPEVLSTLPLDGSTVDLREAVVDDVPAVVRLLAAAPLGATREACAGEHGLQPYREPFRAIDADPAHLLVVAVDDEGVVVAEGLKLQL